MTWNDLTVEQFQGIYTLQKQRGEDELEFLSNIIGLLYNLTSDEVDAIPYSKFDKYCRQVKEMLSATEIPGEPKTVIKANGRKYKVVRDISNAPFGQYVDIVSFSSGEDYIIHNLDKILASCVVPVKSFLGIPYAGKYDGNNHAAIAADMRKAKFTDAYHTAVFFCLFLRNLIKTMRGSILDQLQGIPEAEKMVEDLIRLMDGFIPQNNYRKLKM